EEKQEDKKEDDDGQEKEHEMLKIGEDQRLPAGVRVGELFSGDSDSEQDTLYWGDSTQAEPIGVDGAAGELQGVGGNGLAWWSQEHYNQEFLRHDDLLTPVDLLLGCGEDTTEEDPSGGCKLHTYFLGHRKGSLILCPEETVCKKVIWTSAVSWIAKLKQGLMSDVKEAFVDMVPSLEGMDCPPGGCNNKISLSVTAEKVSIKDLS
ncbi:unnamed protein product, partial [Discosporangium mesarthrocarpum]